MGSLRGRAKLITLTKMITTSDWLKYAKGRWDRFLGKFDHNIQMITLSVITLSGCYGNKGSYTKVWRLNNVLNVFNALKYY